MWLRTALVGLALTMTCTAAEPVPRPQIDDLARLGFRWFQDNRNPQSGLVLDRSPNFKGRGTRSTMASIASTGYFLSLLPEWVRVGWITQEDARRQAQQTLDFAWEKLPHHCGLFYHFMDWQTGARWEQVEVSTLDSAIFFNGCMVAAEAFGGTVADRANALLDRAEWHKFLASQPSTNKELLSLGWTPEKQLLTPADVRSSEMAMPYFLAVGSRTNAIHPDCWYNTAIVWGKVAGYRVLNPTHPLFTSYYGLGWHDLKGRVDRHGVDLELNARLAALANREMCLQKAKSQTTYAVANGRWWGISAGDSPRGYVAPGPIDGDPDGTVWPLASLAAIPWIPRETESDYALWRASKVWEKVCGDYGLSPFSLDRDWVGNDLIGIDVGAFCVNLANHRHGTVRSLWMRHPIAADALRRLGYGPPRAGATSRTATTRNADGDQR